MLSHASILLALAATISAIAAPEPNITPAPKAKRLDLIGGASSLLDGAGNLLTSAGNIGTCISAGGSFLEKNPFPTATGELASAIATAFSAGATDGCLGTRMPSSLSASYSTYEASLVSYYAAHSGEIQSILSSCPTFDGLSKVTPCATALAAAGVTPGASPGGGSGSGNGGSRPTTSTPNAAPRETGLVAGAAAIVGLLGAAALL